MESLDFFHLDGCLANGAVSDAAVPASADRGGQAVTLKRPDQECPSQPLRPISNAERSNRAPSSGGCPHSFEVFSTESKPQAALLRPDLAKSCGKRLLPLTVAQDRLRTAPNSNQIGQQRCNSVIRGSGPNGMGGGPSF